MSSGTGASLPNGTGSSYLSHRPQTPAYTVGNQFVQQFYSVLHSYPDNLHRFYTDESTVTYSDCGSENTDPSSVTVTTQKDIRSKVAEMHFHGARTEIWSVDSQYSSMNGVMVMVTGSLELDQKKKRDFVQTFFLATQEKGYYVLNDQFRYLRETAPQTTTQPKETYNSDHNPALQASLYQQAQPGQGALYYQQVQQAQQQPHHPAYPSQYQNSTPTPVLPSAQVNHQQARHAPVAPAQSQYQQTQAKQTPAAPQTPSASLEPPQPSEPKPAEQVAQKPSVQPAPQPPQPVAPPAQPKEAAPAPPAAPAKAEEPKPAQAAPEPVKPAFKDKEAVASKSTQTPATEPAKPASEPQKPVERPPSGPLTYADRLKIGASGNAGQKPAPVARPQQARPAPSTQQQRPTTSPPTPQSNVKPPETSAVSGADQNEAQNDSSYNASAKEEEVVTTSIFIRNLPEGITAAKLEEVFSEYGKIKGGSQGVSLRQQKGKPDFAFIDFEDQASMQAAISAEVIIDGTKVGVVERKPMLPRDARGGFGGRGRGEGRWGRGGRGDGRGRGREGRPHTTGGRAEGRPEGGRGRGYEGRGHEGGRGRGDRGRGRFNGPHGGRQGPPPNVLQSAAA